MSPTSDLPEPAPAPEPRATPLRWLLLGLANALGPGLAAWALRQPDRHALVLDNQVPPGTSPSDALVWAAASAIPVAAVYILVGIRASKRGTDRPAALRELTGLLAPLAATITLPLLYVPQIESARRLLVLCLILICAGSLALSVATAWPRLQTRPRLTQLASATRAAPAALGLAMLGQFTWLTHLGLVRHQALESRIWDLGIFDNLMFHAARGEWQTTTLLRGETFTSAHCAPILQLLAPIYAIAPGPELLIGLQAAWLVSGAIPLYLLATHSFAELPARRVLGLAFGLAWLAHPSLHGVALFDFHALTLAAPMIVWAMFALETQRRGLWFGMIAALLLTREDLPFVVFGLGIYAFVSGHRRDAAVTVLAAAGTLAVVKLGLMQHPDLFMPDAEASYRYANRFSKVIPDPETGGARDILATVLSNPAFVIQHALTPPKLVYLATLALPCLGLFVASGRALWVSSFGLAFWALGSGTNLHIPYLHYTVFLFPAMLGAAVLGLRAVAERVPTAARAQVLAAAATALICASSLAGERFGALGHSEVFLAGNAPLIRELDDASQARYDWLAEQVASIPADASVAATNTLGPHVSTRAEVFHYRDHSDADWLVLRESEVSRQERNELRRRVRQGELERVAHYGDELTLYRQP